ncbi:DUF3551 domain-containing protein [Bradyrhizobium sp. LHD-71]|uniref:DUF3551 domain-containing protein n=1 Tax=Bradyrhizobium sp. LHD-71 TaxID=3072141 RepID=UPI00280C4F63|nr:DUF3551 domain-containing protein [Bradyrhizobium sp. LHD-71]MDQ8730124.1 DUF3551 domain-containing protein [Bradyrhizobium sp. LHD-71]
MKRLQAVLVLVAGFAGLLLISPASAEMPPFRYCMIGTPNMGRDCTYNSLQLCQVAASAGVGFCEENPAYTGSRQVVRQPRRR